MFPSMRDSRHAFHYHIGCRMRVDIFKKVAAGLYKHYVETLKYSHPREDVAEEIILDKRKKSGKGNRPFIGNLITLHYLN